MFLRTMNPAHLTILGSGTSHGVPMIGCECRTCRSTDPRDRRTNSAALLSVSGCKILIDCGRDFRIQALAQKLKHIDAVVITHNHYDHIAGIDDLRAFTVKSKRPMRVYGKPEHLKYIREYPFSYLFDKEAQERGGIAAIEMYPVVDRFTVCGVEFEPLIVEHGASEIYGYRFLNCAYISDVSRIPDATMKRLTGLDLIVIDGLRYRTHASHYSIEEAIHVIRSARPKKALLTHMCHDVLHRELESRLTSAPLDCPVPVSPAYDGLTVTLPV